MAECKKCGRPSTVEDALLAPYEHCAAGSENGDPTCEVVAAAYRRGVLAARDVIVEHIYVAKDGTGMWFSQEPLRGRYADGKTVMYPTIVIDRFIQDVDRAVREECGE